MSVFGLENNLVSRVCLLCLLGRPGASGVMGFAIDQGNIVYCSFPIQVSYLTRRIFFSLYLSIEFLLPRSLSRFGHNGSIQTVPSLRSYFLPLYTLKLVIDHSLVLKFVAFIFSSYRTLVVGHYLIAGGVAN